MRCAYRRPASVLIARSLACNTASAQNVGTTKTGKLYVSNKLKLNRVSSVRTQSKNETRLTGKVVLDAMGSDHAPHAEIDGALAAARDLGVTVILVGQPEKLVPELKRCGWRGDGDRGIELVEAAEVIGMGEP